MALGTGLWLGTVSDLDDVAKGVVRAAAGGRLAIVSQTKPVRHLVTETVVPFLTWMM
jgi:hypothetical protein